MGIVVVAVIAVALLANHFRSQPTEDANGKLILGAVDQPGQVLPQCVALDAALPADLDGLARRELYVEEPGVAGWGPSPNEVVLRCGLADPVDLTCSSELTEFNGVAWLAIKGTDSTTFVAVDRPVRVALTVTASVGIGPVQALSNVIGEVMPEREVCDNGTVIPAELPSGDASSGGTTSDGTTEVSTG